jgi:hypothetical protein
MTRFMAPIVNAQLGCINIEVEPGRRDEQCHPTGTPPLRMRFSLMNSDRVFEAAARTAKNLLRQNLQPTQLPDAATVLRLRELVHSPSIRSALLHSSDTLLAFALRAVEHIIVDESQSDREIIARLWDILDDPHLNRALGITQNSRFMLGPHPKRR